MVFLILGCMILIVSTGLIALAAHRRPVFATAAGAGGAAAGSVVAAVASVIALVRGSDEAFSVAWMPALGATLTVGMDALSLAFLIPLFVLTGLAAIYGVGYMEPASSGRRAGPSWLCFNVLAASMALVIVARNAVLFLVAWEAMTLSSYFLVVHEHEQAETRRAGTIYLVASQIGTAALLVMFLLLGEQPASGAGAGLDFAALAPASAGIGAAVFVLAALGFGTKAGFVPLHVWLPEAHPAAPSHVSALMSGVMIKMGIYGLVRVLGFLGPTRAWWGWTILAIGVVSGLLGVLFALGQHDIKRLLAYHSVENIGIIAMGIGLGMLGSTYGMPVVAILGWSGALLHVLNHALFKGLLFLGAGAVHHATGTREIDLLGGLARKMPLTAGTFFVGSAAISGLPPLNGFVSEFLIFAGALASARVEPLVCAVIAATVIVALGLIGGMASACFSKAFGITFLGEARSAEAERGHEASAWMTVPMLVLAASCACIGLLGALIVPGVMPVAARAAGLGDPDVTAALERVRAPLYGVAAGGGVLLGLVGALSLARRLLLRGRPVGEGQTWDCGYAAPTARMQYTASSFAQPIVGMFRLVLRPSRKLPAIKGAFPEEARFSSETHDVFTQRVYRPGAGLLARAFAPLRRLQHGNLHLYVLYIVIALLALAVWKLG